MFTIILALIGLVFCTWAAVDADRAGERLWQAFFLVVAALDAFVLWGVIFG